VLKRRDIELQLAAFKPRPILKERMLVYQPPYTKGGEAAESSNMRRENLAADATLLSQTGGHAEWHVPEHYIITCIKRHYHILERWSDGKEYELNRRCSRRS